MLFNQMSNYLYPISLSISMLRGENSLSKENRLILDWIKAHPMCTMAEITEGVGMEMNEVVKRVMKMKGGVVKPVSGEL